MKLSTIFGITVIAGLFGPGSAGASVWFSSAPATVQSGTSYYVEATASGGSFNLTVYKGGGYFCGTSGSGWASTGGSTTDYGAQTVAYQAETYDWNTMEYDYAYAWVTITQANNAPTITWTNTPSTAYVNQGFTIQARGNDSDGNLSAVSIWQNDQPFAFAGGGDGYQGYSSNSAVGTTVGTITFKAKAADSASAESGFIYHNVSIIKYNQSITFNQPAAQTYGGQLALNASASSGLSVGFTVMSGPAYISGTNLLTFAGVGSVVVRASQPGDGTYNAAADVDRTITVNKAGQSITFNQPAAQTYGGQLALSASASSGLGVSFTVLSGPASLSGGTLTFTGAGSVVVRASQGGNANYYAAADVDRTITVNPAGQSITFNQPATQTYGGQLALSASASSGLGVSFAVISGSASLSGSTLTFTGAGSVVVRASQGGNANYYAAANVDRTITVNPAGQTITFNQPAAQTYGGQLALSASASSGLGVSFAVLSGPASLAGNTLTFTGAGSVVVRAAQGGNANYYAASNVDRTITVNKADQAITFAQPAAQTHGGQLALSASASSGLGVSYAVISGSASLSGSTVTFTGAGSVVVRASQGGDANYNAAPNVDRTITVNQITPTGSFAGRTLGSGTGSYTVQAGDLNATFAHPSAPAGVPAPSGTISYSFVAGGSGAVTAGTVLTTGVTYTVRASYPGDANYLAATADAAWTVAADTTPPSVPGGLAASAVTTTGFTLSWNASTDNVGVTAYEVFRNGASQGTTGSTSMSQAGLTQHTAYAMTVRARDSAGNWSASSSALEVTTAEDPAGDNDGDGLTNAEEAVLGTNPDGGSSNTGDSSNTLQLKVQQPN